MPPTAPDISTIKILAPLAGAVLNVIDGVQWGVPISNDNTDYQAILAWVADGNTIEEAD